MTGFIEGVKRDQTTLFPERLEDWIGEDHLVRVVDLCVDQLDLAALGLRTLTSRRCATTADTGEGVRSYRGSLWPALGVASAVTLRR
jgi:hypothetical protein